MLTVQPDLIQEGAGSLQGEPKQSQISDLRQIHSAALRGDDDPCQFDLQVIPARLEQKTPVETVVVALMTRFVCQVVDATYDPEWFCLGVIETQAQALITSPVPLEILQIEADRPVGLTSLMGGTRLSDR
jgi:hypothetical protein